VIVCPRGFSAAAKERAVGLQIDLYSPVDTDPHKWQARVTAPAICDFREAGLSFHIQMSHPLPLTLAPMFWQSLVAHDPLTRQPLATPLAAAIERWERGQFPIEPGMHDYMPIFNQAEVLVDNGYSQLVPVDLKVALMVRSQLFYGQIPIKALSGFRDELSGRVITNAFKIKLIDPDEVEANWVRLNSVTEAPSPVLLHLTGLIGYES
jgi:hypothetical protein